MNATKTFLLYEKLNFAKLVLPRFSNSHSLVVINSLKYYYVVSLLYLKKKQ